MDVQVNTAAPNTSAPINPGDMTPIAYVVFLASWSAAGGAQVVPTPTGPVLGRVFGSVIRKTVHRRIG